MTYTKCFSLLSVSAAMAGLVACSSEGTPTDPGGSGGMLAGASSGGAPSSGGITASGGTQAGGNTQAGGSANSGGVPSTGGATTAGTAGQGGAVAGSTNNGGASSAGGATAGGTAGESGASAGGATSSGGTTAGAAGAASGGAATAGQGGVSSGGTSNSGGVAGNASGGAAGGSASGGAATGGASTSGGAPSTGGSTSTNGCPIKLEGWATTNANSVNGTTGGGNATPTTVTTLAALAAAASDKAARVIIVSGTIKTTDKDGSAMPIASNKTIIGADKNAKIYGGVVMSGVSNVILRNLNIQGVYPNSGPDDTVASHNSHHIWYDHLAIWDAGDGLLDITNQSNYQTVSWTKFYYTNSANGHRLASLNGSGGGDHPEDSRYLKVTYHHNWWGALVNERMPRVMYGQGHQYNNYFNSPGNLYCIGVGSFGSILVENNYFKDVKDPHVFMYDWHMYIAASGNIYDNTTGNKNTGMGGSRDTNDPALNAGVQDAAAFTPPYTYALDKAADVPALVQKCAGPQ